MRSARLPLGRFGPAVWRGAGAAAALLVVPAAIAWASGSVDPTAGAQAAGAGPLPPAVLSPGGMLLRVALGLALVLSLLGGVLMLYRKATRGRPSLRGDASIEVLSQRALGQRTNLTVVRVAGEVLLLGVTQQQVNTLARLTELVPGAPTPAGREAGAAVRPAQTTGSGAIPTPAQDAVDVEALIGSARARERATDFESALAGEVQRVKQGLWTSLRSLEVSDK